MRVQIASIAVFCGAASAASVQLDFDSVADGTIITDQFVSTQNVVFSGELDNAFVSSTDPVATDLSRFFPDDEIALVSASLGTSLAQASLRIEAATGHFGSLDFDVVRRNDQDIHVHLILIDGSTQSFLIGAPGGTGLELRRWSSDDFQTSLGVRAVEIHNGGGTFGVDNLLMTFVPLPTGSALAGLGLLVVGSHRRRMA